MQKKQKEIASINNSGSVNSPVIANSKCKYIKIIYEMLPKEEQAVLIKLLQEINIKVDKALREQSTTCLSDQEKDDLSTLITAKTVTQIGESLSNEQYYTLDSLASAIKDIVIHLNDSESQTAAILNELKGTKSELSKLSKVSNLAADRIGDELAQIKEKLESYGDVYGNVVADSVPMEDSDATTDEKHDNMNEISCSIDDFEIENGVLKKYHGKSKTCIIPANVTRIGDSAFDGCSELTSITIPNSVESIGECAFLNCIGLTSIDLPNRLTSIESFAFVGCRNLYSVTIPLSIKSIGTMTFFECTSLKQIYFEGSKLEWKKIELNDSLDKYSGELIINCKVDGELLYVKEKEFTVSDTEFNIKNGVLKKYYNCDRRCFVIPNGVTEIADEAFKDCERLETIVIPIGVKRIGNRAFEGCKSLEVIVIPSSVESIGEYAFCGCSCLRKITIPNSVERIGAYAFVQCNKRLRIFSQYNGFLLPPSEWHQNWKDSKYYYKIINKNEIIAGKSTRDKSVRKYNTMVKYQPKICCVFLVVCLLVSICWTIMSGLWLEISKIWGAIGISVGILLCLYNMFFCWLITDSKSRRSMFGVYEHADTLYDIKRILKFDWWKLVLLAIISGICFMILFAIWLCGRSYTVIWGESVCLIICCGGFVAMLRCIKPLLI